MSEIVDRQVASGIDVVGDGDLLRTAGGDRIRERLEGFAPDDTPDAEPADLVDYPIGMPRAGVPVACVGRVAPRRDSPLQRDLERLQQALAEHPATQAFLNLPSPGRIALAHANRHYPTYTGYLAALAEALRPEYLAVQRSGILLQLDCSDLAFGRHLHFAGTSLTEFRKVAALHVEALNHALSGIPPGRVRMVVSWGDYEGPHHRDVPLGDIIDLVLRARPGGVVIPFANPRHEHEWRVFEQLQMPESKVLIPGVIDTTTNFVEHPDVVADRIWRFAKLVGVNRLIAGTDGGFAGGRVHPAIAWAKLRALAEGAERASERFAPVRTSSRRPPLAAGHAEGTRSPSSRAFARRSP